MVSLPEKPVKTIWFIGAELPPVGSVLSLIFLFALAQSLEHERLLDRALKRGEPAPDLVAWGEAMFPFSLADEGLEKGEMRDRVLLALDALDVERKAIFVMHDIDEFPVPAIAAQLEIPVNTAYSRLRLAREDFRRAMLRLGKGSAP